MPTASKLSADEAAPETGVGKIFMSGRSQAVRLPKAFRFEGKEVRLRRVAEGVLIEPIPFDIDAWFARMDAIGADFPDPEPQPPMPDDDDQKYRID